MALKIGGVLVSNKILLDQEKPTWMYREVGVNDLDSGWRIFSGTESEEYLDDSKNFSIVSADTIIKIDDSLKANLLASYGFSFEIDPITNHWVIIEKS